MTSLVLISKQDSRSDATIHDISRHDCGSRSYIFLIVIDIILQERSGPPERRPKEFKRIGSNRFTGERGQHGQARNAQSDYFRLAHDPGAIRC